ncbi:hypothetical protein [Kitasatospora sp. NPDC048407]
MSWSREYPPDAEHVTGGLLTHYVVPRLKLVAICQLTAPVAA